MEYTEENGLCCSDITSARAIPYADRIPEYLYEHIVIIYNHQITLVR